MNIALDLDGCFSNFHFSFSKVANQLFGCPIVEDFNVVKAYNWWDWGYPITKEQQKVVWKEIDKNVEDFWTNLEPLVSPTVFKKLKVLENNNHSIYFVTSRRNTAGKNVLSQTISWIQKYSDLEHFSVIVSEKKGKVLDGINADVFLDDYPEHLITATNEAPKCKPFLLVRPYNSYFLQFIKDSHKFKNIGIIYSVDNFLDIIENG